MIIRPEDPRNDGPASKLAIQFQTTILNTPDQSDKPVLDVVSVKNTGSISKHPVDDKIISLLDG